MMFNNLHVPVSDGAGPEQARHAPERTRNTVRNCRRPSGGPGQFYASGFAFFVFTFYLCSMWMTAQREIKLERPLVMGILNVTPDSFSDGGSFDTVDGALAQAERMIADGADIVDIGGESTRPGSLQITADEEIGRVVPVIQAIAERFDTPISVDTSKGAVAKAAVDAGAEIINDISGLRSEPELADVAAAAGAGLIIMHSRGEFTTMHSEPPVDDIITTVLAEIRSSVETAIERGVAREQIVIDVGIGFGKTPEQNLELIAKLDRLVSEFDGYPLLIGASRKSFIGKLLNEPDPQKRVAGSIAVAALAVWLGSKIVRVHDVKATVDAVRIVSALRAQL